MYRNELAAAHARIASLEREVARLRSTEAETVEFSAEVSSIPLVGDDLLMLFAFLCVLGLSAAFVFIHLMNTYAGF